MRYELRFDDALFDVPDGACGVDAGGSDAFGVEVVPVEGGERCAELAGLAVVEEREGLHGRVADLPEAEVVAGGGEEIDGGVAEEGGRGGGVEHELRGRVRVVEGECRVGS